MGRGEGGVEYAIKVFYIDGMKKGDRIYNRGVQRAIEEAGSQQALAEALGVEQPAIYYWLYTTCPPERAIQIEKLYGVPRREIRPDIFDA